MTSRIRRFVVGFLATSGILIASVFTAQAAGPAAAAVVMTPPVIAGDAGVTKATYWGRRHYRRWKYRRWHKPRYYRGHSYYYPRYKRRYWKKRHWRWKRRRGYYGYRSLK